MTSSGYGPAILLVASASLGGVSGGDGTQAGELARSLFLEVPGGRLAFDDTGGGGPLVIAVPGMGDLRGEYRYLRPMLVAAGYRVVTLDIRGHGGSSAGWDDYSAHAIGRDILGLIDHLHAGPAVVIGTSFSAGSAAWAAHDAPDQVAGLIMIGPVVRDLPTTWFQRAALRAGFAGPWRVRFWMMFWNSLFPTCKPPDHAAYRRSLARNLREPGRMAALETMVGLSKRDTEIMLETLETGALVLMGTKDADFPDPAEEAARVAGRIGAEVVMIEGAGHYPHAELPASVGPHVIRFLGKVCHGSTR
jgi:pimeloyl-ACP methyl ester carboxylesterase